MEMHTFLILSFATLVVGLTLLVIAWRQEKRKHK